MRQGQKFVLIFVGYPFTGIGKGTITASTGFLLKSCNLKVCPIKFDGFLNRDIGTMNIPYTKPPEIVQNKFGDEEVFVLDDGTECDADIGRYEKFMGVDLNSSNFLSLGKLIYELWEKEKEFLGESLQFNPHLVDLLITKIKQKLRTFNVVLIEVGGTLGDFEIHPVVDAIRKLKSDNNIPVLVCPIVYLPYLGGRVKLKPIEQMLDILKSYSLNPDITICRSQSEIDESSKSRIFNELRLPEDSLIFVPDVKNIYNIPFLLLDQNLVKIIGTKVKTNLSINIPKINKLKTFSSDSGASGKNKGAIRVGILGKSESYDSYTSLIESLEHSSKELADKVEIVWLDKSNDVSRVDGLIVCGGLDNMTEKAKAIKIAYEKDLPFLGIGIGFDLTVATVFSSERSKRLKSFDRNILKPKKLGSHLVRIENCTKASKIYRRSIVKERYRYYPIVNEFNKKSSLDCVFSGVDGTGKPEIIESKKRKFFVAVKFHPEYISRPLKPHPLVTFFLRSCR